MVPLCSATLLSSPLLDFFDGMPATTPRPVGGVGYNIAVADPRDEFPNNFVGDLVPAGSTAEPSPTDHQAASLGRASVRQYLTCGNGSTIKTRRMTLGNLTIRVNRPRKLDARQAAQQQDKLSNNISRLRSSALLFTARRSQPRTAGRLEPRSPSEQLSTAPHNPCPGGSPPPPPRAARPALRA
jgi:hypothetical protein